MAEMIETICREADEDARSRIHSPAYMTRRRGQDRYFRIEDGFLGLASEFPELAVQEELHFGGTMTFSAINRPDLRLTLARLENYGDNPFARPFRQGKLTQEQSRNFAAGQLSFGEPERPKPKRLVAALCFNFFHNVPLYTEVRFADAAWQCRNEYRDIRALLIESRQVPTEQFADARETTTREPDQHVPSETIAEQRQTPPRRKNGKIDQRDA